MCEAASRNLIAHASRYSSRLQEVLPIAAASVQFAELSTKCLTDMVLIPAAVRACGIPGHFCISHHQPLLKWQGHMQQKYTEDIGLNSKLCQQLFTVQDHITFISHALFVQHSHWCPAGQTAGFADTVCEDHSRLVCQVYARTGASAGAGKAMPPWRLANHL